MITAREIEEFRTTITPDLYDPRTYIGWEEIQKHLSRFQNAIDYLQSLTSNPPIAVEAIATGLRTHPNLYQVVAALLALPQGEIGFSDGRELPDPTRPIASHHSEVALLLVDLGILRLITPGANVKDLVQITLVNQDAGLRRYRVGATIKERLMTVLEQALSAASQNHNVAIETVSETHWPPAARNKVDAVLSFGSRQCIAVTSLFQTALGGRQQTQLSSQYPGLQRELAEYGLNLILVADGRGVRGARDSVLQSLTSGVASCMTFRQAASGRLLQELLRLAAAPPPTQERRALKGIIHAAISLKGTVSATELPGDQDRARIALGAYADENKELDLALNASGTAISWRRKDLVERATRLCMQFQPLNALELFFSLTDSAAPTVNQEKGIDYALGRLTEGANILPNRLLIAASPVTANADLVRKVAAIALARSPEAKMAILLSPASPDEQAQSALRRLQGSLTSNVILLDAPLLLRMTQSKESPLSLIARQALEQSDLIKASPFVVNSVTPVRIFYGREEEEANMVSTLASNSLALLGGRRIGKTSLMRHAAATLRDGGFDTYFGDCQTVRDWDDFAGMAQRTWGIKAVNPFRPAHLFDLVNNLKKGASSKVVILLDEIDQLLDWDKQHTSEEVPEAFFRACRTVSQEGEAQFVFSGERTIAGRLWDPQSPHWNFCAPMMLRQIDKPSAHQLLMRPLQAMQIIIVDKDEFANVAWSRTNGHPQLLQELGDRLVRLLNERPPAARAAVASRDLLEVANTYSYAEHYLETYWGQATTLERLLTMLVASEVATLEQCREYFQGKCIPQSDTEIKAGLRMIELYGITDSSTSGYELRLQWFAEAVKFYGTEERLIEQYISTLK